MTAFHQPLLQLDDDQYKNWLWADKEPWHTYCICSNLYILSTTTNEGTMRASIEPCGDVNLIHNIDSDDWIFILLWFQFEGRSGLLNSDAIHQLHVLLLQSLYAYMKRSRPGQTNTHAASYFFYIGTALMCQHMETIFSLHCLCWIIKLFTIWRRYFPFHLHSTDLRFVENECLLIWCIQKWIIVNSSTLLS